MGNIYIRNPADLGLNELVSRRPTVGDDVSVLLWRAIRIVGFHQILGEDAENVSYLTGKNIGKLIRPKDIDDLAKILTDLKVGRLSFPVRTDEQVHMAIAECVTCDGIKPPLGKAVCQLEVGIVAGALEHIHPDKKVVGTETKCIGGLGDPVCMVECSII